MSKNYLHNYNVSKTSVSNDELVKNNYKKNPINVDINKLLNRVKLEEKKKRKQKLVYFGIVSAGVALMGIFISFVN
jgi:protein tyrosine/serine phosphatase